ncbi:MAG: flagellar hook-associated protein FlgK [Phycisphaerales bacterium]|nr:flagellar hook-associated protein FlgK [Phycisphaerales bacterium]MCB9862531.1 flagellar hook-associated protein FlgK [Phycisphaerales bacterium]
MSSALSVGRTALEAYQATLQVAGQNIANVGTPGYTRSSARLTAIPGQTFSFGQLGNGVRINAIRRNINEALQARLRTAVSDVAAASVERDALNQIEGVLDPLGDRNLGSLITDFFGSLNDLQNSPDNTATRGIVVNTAQSLIQRIRDTRGQLISFRDQINEEITTSVNRADQVASEIADLNQRIVVAEAGANGQASALRDQRDLLLSELADAFEIQTREQPNGAVNVYIGNESLIQFGESFGLKAVNEVDSDGLAAIVVRLKINNGPVSTGAGRIAGLIKSRDVHNTEQVNRLDQLSAGLIYEINRVHSGGQGLAAFSSITGTNPVDDTTVALNDPLTGLAFPPQTGSFFIDVRDNASGEVIRTQINVNLDGIGTDTTLDSLAADITANVGNVTATVLSNGRLEISASPGFSFTFADDTSGALASLGINTFFTGEDALTIGVNDLVVDNTDYVAASTTPFVGDGSNATALVELQDKAVATLGGVSLNEHYATTMADLAVASSSASSANDAASVIFDSLSVQRESVSGVNLDEEAVSLITSQRAYEGAARYMNVVNEMLQTLMTLIR